MYCCLDGGDGRGRGGRGGRGGKRDEPKPAASAAELDAEMDEYFLKSGNKEIAAKKLDDDMDEYWAKKEGGGGGADGEAEVGDEKPTAVVAGGADA